MGFPVLDIEQFAETKSDAILCAGDSAMQQFAKENLGYSHNKGLDFIARIKSKYVIGEAKFLTDFGGHQNAQMNDALATLESNANAIKIAILDGVLYIKNNGKMNSELIKHQEENIMSALLLRDFLHHI